MSGRILVVDDDRGIRDVVSRALGADGFDVETAADGERALELAQGDTYDLMVLDLMLPRLSGSEVCRRLRASENTVPIVMLTARDAEIDRVVGLEVGADDYVTKPFSTPELVSRVRAILRRRDLDRAGGRGAVRRVGGLRIDFARHEVHVDERPVQLTPSEFKLLALLADEPERVFQRRQLMEHLWESDFVGDEHAADVHISNLRRKLERDPRRPERIVTVRGFGYKLVPGETPQRRLSRS
jgi:DNA-binding response OmpR family regulator